jgi:glyceraldehyde-3-phosphate dehydrogenase (NADP+)
MRQSHIHPGDSLMYTTKELTAVFPLSGSIPPEYDLPQPINQQEYLVNGELRTWDGPFQEVVSPIRLADSTSLSPVVLGYYPKLSPEESLTALHAASRAYDHGRGLWPTLTVEARIEHMADFTYRMKARRDEIVRLLMWEIGKSLPDSAKEFDRTLAYIEDTIEALKELDRLSSRFVIDSGVIGQIRRAPLGAVLCMGPYNYPLNETYTTLIPALLMGNTVVFKPPKFGVLLHRPLLEAFRDAFPAGVVNTIYGAGSSIIGPLMASGLVDGLAFIGTNRVANMVKKQHPKPHHLRTVLGLDAKNPGIVLPDADLDLAVRECLLGTLSFNGQRCTALKILFVHRSIADEFLKRFSQAVEMLKPGMPWEQNVGITPLPETDKTGYLSELVEDARLHGAQVVNESGGICVESLFFPAILYPVNAEMRVYTEEQFGPVVPIVPFDDLDIPLNYIVESNFGQQVSLFGRDPQTLARLIDPLVNQVSRVNLNSQCQRGPDSFPFTGRKDSAEGTLSITDALRVFSIRTLVAAKDDQVNKEIITDIVRNNRSNFLNTHFIL